MSGCFISAGVIFIKYFEANKNNSKNAIGHTEIVMFLSWIPKDYINKPGIWALNSTFAAFKPT